MFGVLAFLFGFGFFVFFFKLKNEFHGKNKESKKQPYMSTYIIFLATLYNECKKHEK